jgi:hypothetical protein
LVIQPNLLKQPTSPKLQLVVGIAQEAELLGMWLIQLANAEKDNY